MERRGGACMKLVAVADEDERPFGMDAVGKGDDAHARPYRVDHKPCQAFDGRPIDSLALEIHQPDPVVRALMAANFANWSAAITRCFDAALGRTPPGTDAKALGELVQMVMEGAAMQARTFCNIGYFDCNFAVLRDYITMLLATAKRDSFA